MSDDEHDEKTETPAPLSSPPANAIDPAAARRVQLQLDEVVAQGIYANLALLSHTESEFVIDFAFVPPTRAGARVRSRIVLSPRQAKRLAASLTESITRYESRFGAIPSPITPPDEPSLH